MSAWNSPHERDRDYLGRFEAGIAAAKEYSTENECWAAFVRTFGIDVDENVKLAFFRELGAYFFDADGRRRSGT